MSGLPTPKREDLESLSAEELTELSQQAVLGQKIGKITESFLLAGMREPLFGAAWAEALTSGAKASPELKAKIDSLNDNLSNGEHSIFAIRPDTAVLDFVNANSIVNLVSHFEGFLLRLCKLIFEMHPARLGSEKIELAQVLNLSNSELITYVAERHLNELLYKTPREYLPKLCEILGLQADEFSDEFKRYISIKALRDVGIHNGWKSSDLYLKRLADIGVKGVNDVGVSVLPNLLEHDEIVSFLRTFAGRISQGVRKKFTPLVYQMMNPKNKHA